MLGWRKSSFYRKLSLLPNVILVDPYADNFELISLSRGVMSINGTSNFEALCLQKPQLSFTKAFYSELPSSYVYNHDIDLQKFFDHCVQGTVPSKCKSDLDSLIYFVALMFEHSFPLESSLLWSQGSTSASDENCPFSKVAPMLLSHLFNLK